jgi:hypothetical protein
MTTTKPEPTTTFAFLVEPIDEYGTLKIRADVVRLATDDERDDVIAAGSATAYSKMFRTLHGMGFDAGPERELDGLRVQCRVGHVSSDEPVSTWGYSHYFEGHHIGLAQAEAIVKTLRRIGKGLDRAASEQGYLPEGAFHGYLLRVAAALRIKHIYVYNSPQTADMTGDAFRLVDAPTLQWWIGDRVAAVANSKPFTFDGSR